MEKEIRLLVTQDCNFRCEMCHGEGLQTEKEATMSPHDFAFVFKVGKEKLGMDTTTLTGGEPLFRKDIVEIARLLHEEGAKITLTTNGRLLSERQEIGQYLSKINISIHSLDRAKYESLVRIPGSFDGAMESIKQFREQYPDLPIVINTTCIRGFNSEIEDFAKMIEFAKSINASIKVIELFPQDLPNAIKLAEIAETLSTLGFSTLSEEVRRYKLSDGQTDITLTRIFCSEALESGSPAEFCNSNNDLFLSPDGSAKPCRNDEMEIDLNPALKSKDEQELTLKLEEAFSCLGCRCVYQLNQEIN